ncbi:hypothetical protein FPOAC2_02278 [Fusarium poae]|uniref:hypothetical protein n=1 Tax=Fusarium poae TaxID=36050 RepID=UPI001CE9C8BE|nr:hypothetical protein FPOAC1_002188 [Fusarium poae]KAG8676187.1 hypothetical protein FPOAC1_002188 [Fusarium poae]
MLPSRIGSQRILKPLPKAPSLVRFKNYKEDLAEDRWPTGLTPEARPFRSTWTHPNKNYSVPFTVYNVPNNSEAFIRWPTLKKFMPALNPRAWRTIKAGGSVGSKVETAQHGSARDARVEKQLALMPYMYNDLGVLVYEGPTEKQLQTIGHILKKLVKHEGRLNIRAWNSTEKKVRFDKWNVYRLSVNESDHLDIRWKRGFLLPSGLDELTDMALNKWRHDWKARREAEGKDGRLPVRFSKDSKEMWLLSSKDALGSINETINGPRVTSVDAYVATAVYKSRIQMNIELHTVGTKRFLGCANLRLEPSVDNGVQEKGLEEVKEMGNASPDGTESATRTRKQLRAVVRRDLKKIYNIEAPTSMDRQEPIVHDMTRKLWRLERLIWKKREDAVKKERNEKNRLEWEAQKALRKSIRAQEKAEMEGNEMPLEKKEKSEEEQRQRDDDAAEGLHDEKST